MPLLIDDQFKCRSTQNVRLLRGIEKIEGGLVAGGDVSLQIGGENRLGRGFDDRPGFRFAVEKKPVGIENKIG